MLCGLIAVGHGDHLACKSENSGPFPAARTPLLAAVSPLMPLRPLERLAVLLAASVTLAGLLESGFLAVAFVVTTSTTNDSTLSSRKFLNFGGGSPRDSFASPRSSELSTQARP